jgi:hypothetical protein
MKLAMQFWNVWIRTVASRLMKTADADVQTTMLSGIIIT